MPTSKNIANSDSNSDYKEESTAQTLKSLCGSLQKVLRKSEKEVKELEQFMEELQSEHKSSRGPSAS